VAGIIWYLSWLWLVFEKPSKHPTITPQELHYIEKCIGPVSSVPPNFWTTPWKDIFQSAPVYAIIVANFCRSWTFYLLVLAQITYFTEEFKFGVAEVRNRTAEGFAIRTAIYNVYYFLRVVPWLLFPTC